MNTDLISVPEVSIAEGITRTLESIRVAQTELILLQSQCIGNPRYDDVLKSAADLTGAMTVYSRTFIRVQKLISVPEPLVSK